MLTQRGKTLQTGQTIRFRLIKGPSQTLTADPVDPKAPKEAFPLIAKFTESVVRPDFTQKPWKDGRLYQQDVPKPEEDSDEEESEIVKKKRWRYKDDAPKRQWILQEEVDFLQTMVAKREKRAMDTKQLSSRYEGLPEHNPSHYVVISAADDDDPYSPLTVRTLPPSNVITFAQPAARKTFSLSQAEQVIQDQRQGFVRTMHHHNEPSNTNGNDGTSPPPPLMMRAPRPKHDKNSSKGRLLSRLKTKANDDDVEEADDVMGDVAFRNRKGGGAARREILTSFAAGDGSLKVSDEGVLGGTNDTAFGGRQRFGQFQAEQDKVDAKQKGEAGGQKSERGADGAAMEEDFYQRDVQAEYDELDYDANEQFDDDDVDLGESEVVVDTGGYGEDDEDDELEELDVEEEAVSGAEGLATVAGFKAMLAKARGEVPAQSIPGDSSAAAGAANGDKKESLKRPLSPSAESGTKEEAGEDDHMAKIMAAAEKSAAAAKERAAAATASKAESAIQVDENGLRIITLDAVRREIWLNHGSIPMKRLLKIFDIKKKSSDERQTKFREVVKELCKMTKDPVSGNLLVLKQHYANMG